MTQTSSNSMLLSRRILLCAGPGGVGKTTCASALALAAAQEGKKVVVVTIDPSKRLAQALGLDLARATKAPAPVEASLRGSLHALVLDRGQVFDTIVDQCAQDQAAAEQIRTNPMYKATSRRLGGALEFAAMARVQMLYEEQNYDLIVVDTPPAANALDVLDAPRRVRELVDNPAARLLSGTGRLGFRVMDLGGTAILRQLEQMAGTRILSEFGSFLREFSQVLREFRRRGGNFDEVVLSDDCAAMLVTSTQAFAVRECVRLFQDLKTRRMAVDGILINRFDPPLGELPNRAALLAWLSAQSLVPSRVSPLTTRVEQELLAAQHRGQRSEDAKRELKALSPGQFVCTAARRVQAPQTLDELLALGQELFVAS